MLFCFVCFIRFAVVSFCCFGFAFFLFGMVMVSLDCVLVGTLKPGAICALLLFVGTRPPKLLLIGGHLMEITGVTPYGARKNQFLSIVQEERVFKNQPFQDILSIMHRYFAVTKSSSGQILASQIGIFFACWPTSQSLSFHVQG